ncbi:hypothetical protein ACHAWF_007422 [Thalassiosira exigua]
MSPAAADLDLGARLAGPPSRASSASEEDANRKIDGPLPRRLPRRSSAFTSPTASAVTDDDDGGDFSGESSGDEGPSASDDGARALDAVALDDCPSEERVAEANRLAREENGRLNLNLGMPVDLTVLTRRDVPSAASASASAGPARRVVRNVLRPPIRVLVCLLDRLLSLVENPLFRFWSERVPLRLRQRLTFAAWGMYLPIHKALIGRRTGLHRDASLEYHALTSVMWWGRLFPVTVKRMRMSLSLLHVWHPPDRFPRWDSMTKNAAPSPDDRSLVKPTNGARYGLFGHLHEIYHRMTRKRTPTGFRDPSKELSEAELTVTGHYVQHSSRPSKKVLLWIFGGAFLAGDGKGNLGVAEKVGMMCASEGGTDGDGDGEMRDVFVPDYPLVPERHLDDAIHAIALAYEYLIYERRVRPADVTLVGVSSGGGLVVLLFQALAEARRSGGKDCVPMPAGGVLIGPFVDYTEPMGSMKEYVSHDLIVNQSVYDEGIPYLERVLGSKENRIRASPVYGNFEGLPPLCICVSQHEVVYDQAMTLAKRAEGQGVEVTLGVWKYLCHVFPLLCAFLPEGRESLEFMCGWIKER